MIELEDNKGFSAKNFIVVEYLSKSLDYNHWQNICIVTLIFSKVHFLDLGEFSTDLIVFVTVVQLNYIHQPLLRNCQMTSFP